MPPLLAASLLDNPWIILVFILGSAVVNWLASRRKQAMEDEAEVAEEAGPEPVPPARRAAVDPELEEALRRFLGKSQPPFREAPPVPPPLIPPAASQPPPPVVPRRPVAVPAPVPARPGGVDAVPVPGGVTYPLTAASTARRLAARTPALCGPTGPARPLVATLRSRAGAREAWKLSVILGPPGGLES